MFPIWSIEWIRKYLNEKENMDWQRLTDFYCKGLIGILSRIESKTSYDEFSPQQLAVLTILISKDARHTRPQ